MSIYTKSSIVAQYPAFDVIKRESQGVYNPDSGKTTQVVNLIAGETLVKEDHLGTYQIGSVVSYALENNECPIKAWERAVDNNHGCYWINACATVISSSHGERETHIVVDEETIYCFQGLYFNIKPTFNNNLKLVEVTLE